MIYNNLDKAPGNLKDYLDKQLKRGKYSEAESPSKCIYINQDTPADPETPATAEPETNRNRRGDVSRKRKATPQKLRNRTGTRKQQKQQPKKTGGFNE